MPKRWSNYKFLAILITTVAILAIATCQRNISQLDSSSLQSPVATKTVNHALGKVKIPLNPQRIIVLDEHQILDPVLALGIEPVGVLSGHGSEENFRGIPNELVAHIPDVGNRGQPSLEKILSLKPDLILAREWQKNSYELFTNIAPTVLIDFPRMYDFKERLRYLAQVLGKSNRAEELLTQYQNRIQQLRQQLGKQLETRTISVIYLGGFADFFSVSRPDYLAYGQIINDVGLQRPLIQQNQKESYLRLSIEVLPKHDADVLFVMTNLLAKRFKQANPEPLSFLKNPIWSTLKAAQNKQVHNVKWTVGGPIGANRIIDDLFKYLVDEP